MIRRGSGSGSDQFINVSNGGSHSSKLEEKQKRLKESERTVQVTKVDPTNVVAERVNESKKLIRDEEEVPTGFLDEEEEEINSRKGSNYGTRKPVDEDEVPTGFLDDEEEFEEDNSRLKVLKVEKVTKPIEQTSREEPVAQRQRRDERRNIGAPSGEPQNGGMRNPVRPRRQPVQNTEGRPVEPREHRSSGGFVATEPPVREEDRRPSNDNTGMTPPKQEQKKGSKGGLIVGLLAVIVIGVGGAIVVPRIMNKSTTEGKSSITLETVSSMVDALYTDATKVNIRDDVTEVEVDECSSALDSYQNSVNYNAEDYDKVSKEISTIKFFLQDMGTYDDLVHGVYEYGSDEYNNQVSIIKSDIYLYSVAGLADTMSTKVKILETTSGAADEVGEGNETVVADENTTTEEMQVEEEPTDGDTVIEYQEDDNTSGDVTTGDTGNANEEGTGSTDIGTATEEGNTEETGSESSSGKDYSSAKSKASELVNQVLGEIQKGGN